MPRALSFLDVAINSGREVIGSSSLSFDPARERYPSWAHLPYITDAKFADALRHLVASSGITEIFSPHPVVWNHIQNHCLNDLPGVVLVNESPVTDDVAPFHKALAFANKVQRSTLPMAWGLTPVDSADAIELAALFRHAEAIPGMCDHEKIGVLCDIFRCSPAGDVVEIGSWWGKSAFVLAQLAKVHQLGSTLCVDPWTNEHLAKSDGTGLVDAVPFNADEAFTVFQINMVPYANGTVNYLRLPSTDAALRYRDSRTVVSPHFGTTQYTGRIAILHIDGNHSYESVQADVKAWQDFVVPGGWIVIDDYIWAFGDGPKRVGDEFIAAHSHFINTCFVASGNLYVNLTSDI